MIFSVDLNSKIPIYEQLCSNIINGIQSGELKPNDKLPSVRDLAIDIGVNLNTVNKAYKILKEENFVTTSKKYGTVINETNKFSFNEYHEEELRADLYNIVSKALVRGFSVEQIKNTVENISDEFSILRGEQNDN